MTDWLNHPARMVPLAFLLVILAGATLLMLPIARTEGLPTLFLTALFIATSAVVVTGLSPVDTATYWTGYGQGVIYMLFHIGGFCIMSAATLLGMVVSRRIGLGRQVMVQAEARGISPSVLREAMAVTALAVAVLMLAAMVLRALTDLPLSHLIYEALAAFGNVGLSMGITASLNEPARWGIIFLMYLGRVGIVTVATGLAFRPRRTDYRYPEERPIVG